jgi:hypothetical protein
LVYSTWCSKMRTQKDFMEKSNDESKNVTAEPLTKGERKILLQFERFTETDEFKNEVKRIRKLVKLPINGIEPTEEDIKGLGNIFRVPDNLPLKKASDGKHPLRILNIEARKISNRLPIDNLYLTMLVRYYVVYNRFFYDELERMKQSFHESNVCELEDAQSEFDEYAPSDDPDEFYSSFSVRGYIDMLENKLWKYPIVLRMHPDASQRDIIEYIKVHWNYIQYYQGLYSNKRKTLSFKNSKTKVNQNTKARNDFIYQNKHLPAKEIAGLLGKQKIYLDVGHIGKIISLEKKKRETK